MTLGARICRPNYNLNSNLNPKVRESAILALGALQSGAGAAVNEFLPQVLPFLLEHTAHPCPQVRDISLWTLGRYLSTILERCWSVGSSGEDVCDPSSLGPIAHALLARVSDPNKKVQQFAASTVAIFFEAQTPLSLTRLSILAY